MPDVAVLIVAFGGPEKFEDVRPFIEKVVRGRNVPAARVDAVVEQYKAIGGSSPFNKLTEEQRSALQSLLGPNVPVSVGYLNCEPTIEAAVGKIIADGVKTIVVLIMAAHRSEASYERYVNAVASAVGGADVELKFAQQFHLHGGFIDAVAARLEEQLAKLPTDSKAKIVFTAHSIPTHMSDESAYAKQIGESAAATMGQLAQHGIKKLWTVAYQSRSGSPSQPWLEPDVQEALSQAKREGFDNCIVVPVGFLCDHVEVLYDLDVLAASHAAEEGMNMLRAQTVGSHPRFIDALETVLEVELESLYAKPERR